MDAPKSLASPAVRQARFGMLQQLHVLALTRYVESLRLEMGSEYGIPYFDPLDGGTDAECLFLLEAPGPKAIATGFVSRNNPDETAKNFFQLNRDAGLERKRTVVWNIVPWYIGSGTKIRPATTRDLGQAAPALADLLTLLPAVHTIV
ncbi:uracil-DNA glycosylase, partial [Xanthomonas hortorum]